MNFAAHFLDKPLAQFVIPAIGAVLVLIVVFLLMHRPSRPVSSIRTNGSRNPHNLPSDRKYAAAYSSSFATPLFLLLGPPNSGQSAILDALKEAFPEKGRRMRPGIGYFDPGVVLEGDGGLFVSTPNGNGNGDRWKKFVDRLQRRRPQRPIDGVVLTISCQELVGETALSSDQWQQRAAQMSKNLRLMRDRFGFCFPVYVVVTKCHAIRGFQEFAASRLQQHLREIFGWSNPYNLDAAFSPRWTEQAFRYIGQVLEKQRSYFFSRRNSGNGNSPQLCDELFLFPVKFQELKKPVACFLENLFHESGHRDALQFRGLYFSGHARATQDDFVEPHRHSNNGHLAEFTAELFGRKIFPERTLARPVDTTLTPRNREVSAARMLCWVAAIVLFSGAGWGWHTLSSTTQKTRPLVKSIASALRSPRQVSQVQSAYDAVYMGQALSGTNFQSSFLPLSLVAGVDSNLKQTMQPVFTVLVYPGLHDELQRRTSELVSDPLSWGASQSTRPASSIQPASQSVDAPQRLAGFVNDLVSLEDNIILFNSVANGQAPPQSRNGKDMLALVTNLAPSFFADVPQRSNSAMDAIVRGSHGALFQGSPWNDRTIKRLETMVTGVLGQRLNEEKLRGTLYAASNRINLLEAGKLDSYQQLDDLHTSLAQLQGQLAAPDLEWIAKDEFQLPPDLNKALAPLFSRPPEQNVLLCDTTKDTCTGLQELEVFVKRAVRGHFSDFRTELLAAKSNTTGNLIAVSDGKLQLSPSAARMQTVLDGFLKLPFVARQGVGRIQDVQFCRQLTWNSTKLQEALQDKAAYDKFFNDLANSQDSFQDTLQGVALDRLEDNMVDAIAAAEEFQNLADCDSTLHDTSGEARNFAAVAQPLAQLLTHFSELNFDDDYQDLKRVSTQHAFAVLSRLDRYFERRNFYWPANRDFSSWMGKTQPSTAAYNAHGLDDMLAYLSLQRQEMQPYVASAKPLVRFLQEQSPTIQKQSTLIAKWVGIINDLEKYPNSPASSSLGSLENYLATELDKTVPPDCQMPVTPAATIYFSETQRSIERAIAARCRFLSQHRGMIQYSELADFFNQHLKGKFPFCKPSAEDAAEADPSDVTELFRLLDADSKAIHEAVQASAGTNSYTSSAMATFVNQLDSLRALFGSLLSGETEKAPAWDFVPVFRVNRNHELHGNQIIDWTLLAGDNSFHNFEVPKTGHWSFGQPVALTLRWAKDSPTRPIAPALAYSDPATKTVVFEYKDRWSLLRMLVKHAAPSDDFDRKVDPDPQTLVFTIPQQVIPEDGAKEQQPALLPGNQTAGPDVKVFIRIRLFSPGKTTSLRLPVFPAEAPKP